MSDVGDNKASLSLKSSHYLIFLYIFVSCKQTIFIYTKISDYENKNIYSTFTDRLPNRLL